MLAFSSISQRQQSRATPYSRGSSPQYLLLESAHLPQRARQTLVVPQQVKHLAELQLGGVLHLHEALDRRADLGQRLPGRENGSEVREGLEIFAPGELAGNYAFLGSRF